MFEKQTTLILGAGASAPFGFPLSTALHTSIIDGINVLASDMRQNSFRGLPGTSAQNANMFARQGTIALASYLSSPLAREYVPAQAPARTIAEWMIRFRDGLQSQTHDSVDRFIADNPQHAFIGKCFLALHIATAMYALREHRYVLRRDFAERAIRGRRNWYHQLINHLRAGASTAADLSRTKLSIITFNYDLSLECALDERFADTERHAGAEWRKIISILHVNGAPLRVPPEIHDVGKFIIEYAQHMHLVDETADSGISQLRATARGTIIDSDRVFVMGFHFDDANVAAIGLSDHPNKSKVFCLNFSGHQGVTQRICALGVGKDAIRVGSPSSPLHIDTAIDEGFLEQ